MKKNTLLMALISLFLLNSSVKAQTNPVDLFIEPLSEQEAYDIKGGTECQPGDIVITIKSDITGLTFDSNVIDIVSVTHDSISGEYIFCHSKESFWLTVSSESHISKKVYIDGKSNKYAFRVVEKTATGKIYVKTNPNNALIDFGFSGQSPQLSSYPIEMNSGEYKIRISKNGYQSADTTIIVPSDGSTKQMNILLRPVFGKILLDITSSDKTQFQVLPVIDIDTAHINLADLQIKEKLRSFDAAENVQYFKLYEGGYIPVPVGSYSVTINSPGFKTYNSQVLTQRGGTSRLVAKMNPIVGYLTLIDYGNAIDAEVYMDDEMIGKVPLFKKAIRVGDHKLKIVKNGFIASEEMYTVLIQENLEFDLPVKMSIYKEIYLSTLPAGAEVLVNEKRVGFTPLKISLSEGEHELVMKRKGSLDIRKKIIIDSQRSTFVDTLKYDLENTLPLLINCERDGLRLTVKRDNEVIFKDLLAPGEILVPKGKYLVELHEDKSRRFKGNVDFKDQKSVMLPCYSVGTFTTLAADLFLSKPKAVSTGGSFYSMLATGSFGRFNVFPGFSTSILKVSVFSVNDQFKGRYGSFTEGEKNISYNYANTMIAGSILFLNGEVRIGGAISRKIDISALGTYTYHPSLSILKDQSRGVNHVSGTETFVGLELTSRISAFNLNVKIGNENFNGDYKFTYEKALYSYSYYKVPFKLDNLGIKIGITLGQKVSRSNNMIRLWNKPVAADY